MISTIGLVTYVRRVGVLPAVQTVGYLLKLKLSAFASRLAKAVFRRLARPSSHLPSLRRAVHFMEQRWSLRPRNVRRFVDPALGRVEFLRRLNERGVRYVVLRWFDTLPDWPAGEDIDLLVDDSDIDRISDLFVAHDRSIPCDVYSVSPLRGATFNGVAYFPPNCAESVLETRVAFQDTCYVPDAKHLFLTLAYHAVYHKAEKSGLPWDSANEDSSNHRDVDHDYAQILRRAATDEDHDVKMTFLDLHNYLSGCGWTPPLDMLRKLATKREWLRRILPDPLLNRDGELLVFILRQSATRFGFVEEIVQRLKQSKLEILVQRELSDLEICRASKIIRGGNWGPGPFPQSGGPPSVIVVAFDFHPRPVNLEATRKWPFVQNGRILIKHEIRRAVNRRLPLYRRSNCIHSSDDEIEAREYLAAVDKQLLNDVSNRVDSIKQSYMTKNNVIRVLGSCGSRGKVELIDFNGELAVKKTFRGSADRFLRRELIAYRELSLKCSQIPEAIDCGANYVILPYFENVLEGLDETDRREALRPHAADIVRLMQVAYESGYMLVDFYPDNVLLTPESRLIFVDFEFLQPYETKPDSFLKSAEIAGLPEDFQGDLPRGLRPPGQTFANTWQPVLGLSLEEVLPTLEPVTS